MGNGETNRDAFTTMTNEEYHAGPGISSSKLKLLDESERHLEMSHLFSLKSDSMDFGTLVHALVLEPEKENGYAVMPNFDGRTTAGKSEKLDWLEDNDGKNIIDKIDFDRARRMADNVLAIAGGLITLGVKEQSYFVEEDGLLLKCRPDNYIESHGIVVDLKTISSKRVGGISEWDIKHQVNNLRYDRSAAFYMKVLNLLDKPAEQFVFVFVDSTSPYMVKIRELEQPIINRATQEIDAMLDKYREYLRTKKANVIKTLEIGEMK